MIKPKTALVDFSYEKLHYQIIETSKNLIWHDTGPLRDPQEPLNIFVISDLVIHRTVWQQKTY